MEELRVKIIEEINKSGLPLEAVVFVIRDVYRDVNEAFKQYQQQSVEPQKEEEDSES